MGRSKLIILLVTLVFLTSVHLQAASPRKSLSHVPAPEAACADSRCLSQSEMQFIKRLEAKAKDYFNETINPVNGLDPAFVYLWPLPQIDPGNPISEFTCLGWFEEPTFCAPAPIFGGGEPRCGPLPCTPEAINAGCVPRPSNSGIKGYLYLIDLVSIFNDYAESLPLVSTTPQNQVSAVVNAFVDSPAFDSILQKYSNVCPNWNQASNQNTVKVYLKGRMTGFISAALRKRPALENFTDQ